MITEAEKDKALEILRQYEDQSDHVVRSSIEEDCPSEDFDPGEPSGECDGDGHYLCRECIHWNKETKYQ